MSENDTEKESGAKRVFKRYFLESKGKEISQLFIAKLF